MFIVLCSSLHTYHEDNGPATSGDISTELPPHGSAAALSFLSLHLSPIHRNFTVHALFEGKYKEEKMDKNESSLLGTCLDPSQSICNQWLPPEKWKFQHNLQEESAAFRAVCKMLSLPLFTYFFVQHISPQTLQPLGIDSLWCVL